jgi:DNA-directed RNA polymerase specialized sigma24 family protein
MISTGEAVGNGQRDHGWFATTHWSVVLAAQERHSVAAQQALGSLCRSYWYPLYGYVRRQGYSPEDAQDLTQGFFERFIEKDYLATVDRAKGRFRAFLLGSLKNFLSDQRRRERAAKRGGGERVFSLDSTEAEDRFKLEPVDTLSPDRLYERSWALTVLERTYSRLRDECAADDETELYELFKESESKCKQGERYAVVGQRIGRSEAAIKAAVWRLRQRFREMLRKEIAQTVALVTEIDQEIKYLAHVLAGNE